MTLFSKKMFQRAAPWGVALFFALPAGAAKTESDQELIERAYNLSLQKDRTQAVSLLVTAAKKENNKKTGPPKELLVALQEVSGVFYSDKAQQLYELALSLKSSDPNLAVQKLNEAARQEPENQQITLEQVRLQVGTGDCDGALRQAKKWTDRNPFSEELRLVAAQAALCLGQSNEYLQIKAQGDFKKSGLEIFWQALELEQADRAGLFAKGREQAQALAKSDAVFPETYYWLWKFEHGLKLSDERSGLKYLAACKSLSSRSARQYQAEPRLCRRTAEVEQGMKKTGSSNE